MGKVINIDDYRKNEKVEKEAEIFANGFTYLLEMPDDLFKAVYSKMKEEFLSSVKSGEFEKDIVQQGISEDEKASTLATFEEIIDTLKEENLCSEKISFVELIRDSFNDIFDNIGYRDSVEVALELCHPNAKEPAYANPDDAGCDVYAVENTIIAPKETKIIPTGLKMAIPSGWMVSVRPRSGMSAKTDIRVANAPGTIDTGYRNEVGIILHNTGDSPYEVKAGDRIAQFVIEPAPMIRFKEVESVEGIGNNRGGGFGHTGE